MKLRAIDGLRYKSHPIHAHFDQTLEWTARAKPARAILTHMNHETDDDELLARRAPGVEPGHDGLVVEL